METLQFKVANMKCQGCVANVRNGLVTVAGVNNVDVDLGRAEVTVQGDHLDRQQITAKLAQLGYPEKA
ncbi:MAG: heavy-metal-associated domain-containing protein [Gammaproteobacteria bacterium]|nr:heavy-metal-associated domain-containing protein [Gammaproteobacteria bacterium]